MICYLFFISVEHIVDRVNHIIDVVGSSFTCHRIFNCSCSLFGVDCHMHSQTDIYVKFSP